MEELGKQRYEEDHGPIGFFPSWRWLYVAVVVYTFALTVLLYVLTITLDHASR